MIVKKPQPSCLAQQREVPFSHKGRVFVTAPLSDSVPDSKLCALLLFFFSPSWSSVTPPLRCLLAVHSWELNSHWLERTPGRIWEVFFCLHVSRENPNNNGYLQQPGNTQQPRRHARAHTQADWAHTGNEITGCQIRSLFFLIL